MLISGFDLKLFTHKHEQTYQQNITSTHDPRPTPVQHQQYVHLQPDFRDSDRCKRLGGAKCVVWYPPFQDLRPLWREIGQRLQKMQGVLETLCQDPCSHHDSCHAAGTLVEKVPVLL